MEALIIAAHVAGIQPFGKPYINPITVIVGVNPNMGGIPAILAKQHINTGLNGIFLI